MLQEADWRDQRDHAPPNFAVPFPQRPRHAGERARAADQATAEDDDALPRRIIGDGRMQEMWEISGRNAEPTRAVPLPHVTRPRRGLACPITSTAEHNETAPMGVVAE